MNSFKTWPRLLVITLILCLTPAGLSAADADLGGVVAPGSAAAAAAVPVKASADGSSSQILKVEQKPKTLVDVLKTKFGSPPSKAIQQILFRASKIAINDYQDNAVRCGLGGFFANGSDVQCTQDSFKDALFVLRGQVASVFSFQTSQDEEFTEYLFLSDYYKKLAKFAVAEYFLYQISQNLEKNKSPQNALMEMQRQALFLIAEYAKSQLPQLRGNHTFKGVHDFDQAVTLAQSIAAQKSALPQEVVAEVAKDPLYIPRGVFVFTATPGRKVATTAVLLAIISAAVGGVIGFKKLLPRYKKWRKKHRKASFWQFVKTFKLPKLKQRAKKTSGVKQSRKKPMSKKEVDLLRNLGLSS